MCVYNNFFISILYLNLNSFKLLFSNFRYISFKILRIFCTLEKVKKLTKFQHIILKFMRYIYTYKNFIFFKFLMILIFFYKYYICCFILCYCYILFFFIFEIFFDSFLIVFLKNLFLKF